MCHLPASLLCYFGAYVLFHYNEKHLYMIKKTFKYIKLILFPKKRNYEGGLKNGRNKNMKITTSKCISFQTDYVSLLCICCDGDVLPVCR